MPKIKASSNPPYLAMRRHDNTRYRVWAKGYYGDQFEVVPASQIPVMRETCRILGVPVYFLHANDDEVSADCHLRSDSPLPE